MGDYFRLWIDFYINPCRFSINITNFLSPKWGILAALQRSLMDSFQYIFHYLLYVRSDNSSEFIAKELRELLKSRKVKPAYIYPRKPWQNGYNESLNGKFLDECLDQELFLSKVEDQVVSNWWRQIYNWKRPHRSLEGDVTL